MKPEDFNPVRDMLGSLGKGVKRKSQKLFGPFKYTLNGKAFRCSHCGNDHFHKGKGQTNTRFMSLMGLDWLDTQMTVLTCSECGLLFWLSQEPEKED
jgi:predicted nucleic-acid-binding Zn-ribbon protein